jgi:hypothetical protein
MVLDVNAAILDDLDRDSRIPTVKVGAQIQNQNALTRSAVLRCFLRPPCYLGHHVCQAVMPHSTLALWQAFLSDVVAQQQFGQRFATRTG